MRNSQRGRPITRHSGTNTPSFKHESQHTLQPLPLPFHLPDTDFVKWIKAPACKLIKITFTDFELYQKTDKTVDGVTVNACWHDHLELRTSNMLEGDW